MKTRIYLRVAKGGRKGFRVSASPEPTNEPIKIPANHSSVQFLPTVSFAVDFEIPDELFYQAETPVAEINLAIKNAKIEGSILVAAVKEAVRKIQKVK